MKRDLKRLYESVHMDLTDEDLTYLMAIMNPHELDIHHTASFIRFALFLENNIFSQIDHAMEDAFYMFTEIGDRKHWHEVPDEDIVMTKDQLSHGLEIVLGESSKDLIDREDIVHMEGFKEMFRKDMDSSSVPLLPHSSGAEDTKNKLMKEEENDEEEDDEKKLLRKAMLVHIDPNSSVWSVYFRMLRIHIPLQSILHKATLKGFGPAEVLALKMALERVIEK